MQSDLFEASLRAAGVSGVEIGTTVYVTNLDQGVTNDDIRVYSLASLRFQVLCLFFFGSTRRFLKFVCNYPCGDLGALW